MRRPAKFIVDLFCGGGLASDGYVQAGHVTCGIDIVDQPHYPFSFGKHDALDWLDFGPSARWRNSVIHASPPCQAFTRAKHLRTAQGSTSSSGDLLTPTLDLLRTKWHRYHWIVENVENAKSLMQPRDGERLIRLCGSSFGLGVQRHRLFLTNIDLPAPPPCNHSTFEPDPITSKPRPWGVYHVPGDNIPSGGRTARNVEHGLEVMGVTRRVPWAALKEGIPPAYTKWIGEQL